MGSCATGELGAGENRDAECGSTSSRVAKVNNGAAHDDMSLELSSQQLRELVDQAMQRLSLFLDTLPEQPTSNLDGAEQIARSVSEPLPESGVLAEEVLDQLFDTLIPASLNPTSPGYMAYVPGGGLPQAAVADLISGITNRFVGIWHVAPAVAQIEATVIRWFCSMVGYPGGAGGFLTSGGSLANWSAIVTARRCRLPDNFLNGVLYTSDQAHHSVTKAAILAGFPTQNVRSISVDARFRIRIDALANQIARDRHDGLQPFCLIAHAGTVNTGAVDELAALAELAEQHHLWMHVDAAYGGFFLLTERGRERLQGIERADSITIDPHKGLFLPYGTGGLLVRDRNDLKHAHCMRGDYIPPAPDDPDFVDFSDISPELSRGFRGLRIWLPFKLHGASPFRSNLNEKLDLASWATSELRQMSEEINDELEIVAEPQLSMLAFRLVRPGLGEDELNRLNGQLLERINSTGRVMLSATRLHNRYVIRVCILSFRTHRPEVATCLHEIRQAISSLSG